MSTDTTQEAGGAAGAAHAGGACPDRRAAAPVSCVVVTYHTGPSLRECLEALAADPAVREIIVVDNGNDVATRRMLVRLAAEDRGLRLLTPARNIGFAAGCNFGAAHAEGSFVAFVNPDCIVPPQTFDRILAVFAQRRDAWLCGGRLLNMDGTEQRGGRREILSPWRAFIELTRLERLFPDHPYFRRLHLHEGEAVTEVIEVPTVSGAFMVLPRDRFEAVGGMDDNMFLHFDDADLCIRVMQQGGKVLYCGNAPIYHYLSTSDVSRAFIEWHKTRSTSYYFYKHFHSTYPFWVLTLVSMLLWLRFGVLAARALPRDLKRVLRRG